MIIFSIRKDITMVKRFLHLGAWVDVTNRVSINNHLVCIKVIIYFDEIERGHDAHSCCPRR